MLLKDLVELKRQETKGNADEQECAREWILSFASFGIDKEEYKTALQMALPETPKILASWRYLKEMIYQYFLIDIGEEDNPNIREVFFCWLNLDTMELSTIKTYNPFEQDDNCVMIKDYRILGAEVLWKDIALKGEYK